MANGWYPAGPAGSSPPCCSLHRGIYILFQADQGAPLSPGPPVLHRTAKEGAIHFHKPVLAHLTTRRTLRLGGFIWWTGSWQCMASLQLVQPPCRSLPCPVKVIITTLWKHPEVTIQRVTCASFPSPRPAHVLLWQAAPQCLLIRLKRDSNSSGENNPLRLWWTTGATLICQKPWTMLGLLWVLCSFFLSFSFSLFFFFVSF